MRNEIVSTILEKYENKKMGQKIHEDFENLMDELKNELQKSESAITAENNTIEINVKVEVPEDFEMRLDQSHLITQQIIDDKWFWSYAPKRIPALELERIFIAKDCRSFASFIEGARYVEEKLGLWD
jgi:hypothetical protein